MRLTSKKRGRDNARCSDAFAPSDLAAVEAALSGGDAIAEVLERTAEVIDAMDERLTALGAQAA